MKRPAVIDMPWLRGGPWVRVTADPPPRPVDLSGDTRLPLTSRQRKARASVAILCPAEPVPVEDEPAGVPETDAQRRARRAEQATAGWA